jgi:nitroreductase
MLVQTFVKGTSGFNNGVADNMCGDLWGAYDLGLSTAYLILKAKDLGLDTLIMGMRNGDFLREALQIPENEELMAVIAVGYKDEEPALRPRKPADEIVKFF